MTFCYFAFREHRSDLPVSEDDVETLRDCVSRLTGLHHAHFYRPAEASDRFADDGTPPAFGMQLFFSDIAGLETAIGPDGALATLALGGRLRSFAADAITHQAMLNRPFPVPEPAAPGKGGCSYVVHYPGPADNLNDWLRHYLHHHPQIMARFPGIREIEIATRIDWIDAMPWRRVHHMQRNRVMFDNPEALTAALHSPVRQEMRDDLLRFPPFQGGNRHYPMATEVVPAIN